MIDFDFSGTRTLILGGSRGIGFSVADAISKANGEVLVLSSGRTPKSLLSKKLPATLFIEADMGCTSERKRALNEVKSTWNSIDFIIFSVGAFAEDSIQTVDEIRLTRMMEVNLYSAMFMIKGLFQEIKSANGKSIVLISSILASQPDTNVLSYSITKSALDSFAKNLALEFSQNKIRVNTISPSFVNTDMIKDLVGDEKIVDAITSKHPLGRIGEPIDIANVAMFLLSNESSWITGQNVVIDGGRSLVAKG